ncbi:hypothetical protein KAU33_05905, partial [Candidatus Dependentiae bacterium]|nr:hypothetical protein [Candidatus Dependentiae bacterium]
MNLNLRNYKVAEVDKGKGFAKVIFDVSWGEAWKNSINCDGVYIFGKYKDKNGLWKHINLLLKSDEVFNYEDQSPGSFSVGEGGVAADMGIWVPDTNKGFFLFRTKDEGDVSLTGVTFQWDISEFEEDIENVEIKVFGLEMVYIPEEKHYVG